MRQSQAVHQVDDAEIHTDAAAGRAAEHLGARAVTFGKRIYFGEGEFRPDTEEGAELLRHELVHTQQSAPGDAADDNVEVAPDHHAHERQARHASPGRGLSAGPASGPLIYRKSIVRSPVEFKTGAEIFGDAARGTPAMTLGEFQDYCNRQADWLEERTLSDAEVHAGWELLFLLARGHHIRAGMGDLSVADIRRLRPAQLEALEAFCRGVDPGEATVRIHNPASHDIARRVALGTTLLELERLVEPEVLQLTVSDDQLARVHDHSMMPALELYWKMFHPNLNRTYTHSEPGASGAEFEKLLDYIDHIGGVAGLPTLNDLKGWMRNPHRFGTDATRTLRKNLGDTSGKRPLVLVVHTANDNSAFQGATEVYDELIKHPANHVLLIEGAPTVAEVTARIPTIAATWGHPDAHGVRKINQVILAGHGQQESMTFAGFGAPTVHDGKISYPSDSLDVVGDRQQTQDFLDALFQNMDPTTATLLFEGCLVGAGKVPRGTSAADIPDYVRKYENLANFARSRASAAGIDPTTVWAAQASTGKLESVHDTSGKASGSGRVQVDYKTDPHAYGLPSAYLRAGNEPEGLMRAAIEVGVRVSPVAAADGLRAQLLRPNTGDWWQEISRLFAKAALQGVPPGGGIDLARVNELAYITDAVFMVVFHDEGYGALDLDYEVNHDPFWLEFYTGITATTQYRNDTDIDGHYLRLQVNQARLQKQVNPARQEFIGAVKKLNKATTLSTFLQPSLLKPYQKELLPTGRAPDVPEIQLALAWHMNDPDDPYVAKYLRSHIDFTAAKPRFQVDFAAEIRATDWEEHEFLSSLGVLGQVEDKNGETAQRANAEVTNDQKNDVYVEVSAYKAEVWVRALNVRVSPSTAKAPVGVLRSGDVVRVMGYSGRWAAIEHGDHLRFVWGRYLWTGF